MLASCWHPKPWGVILEPTISPKGMCVLFGSCFVRYLCAAVALFWNAPNGPKAQRFPKARTPTDSSRTQGKGPKRHPKAAPVIQKECVN